jgi:hypothetical protein
MQSHVVYITLYAALGASSDASWWCSAMPHTARTDYHAECGSRDRGGSAQSSARPTWRRILYPAELQGEPCDAASKT